MAKEKKLFYCKECGAETGKWQGQCPGCGEWNTLVEAPVIKTAAGKTKAAVPVSGAEPTRMKDIAIEGEQRLLTGIKELDRVLGGGIVAGSLVLVGGDPGIGKSTLLLPDPVAPQLNLFEGFLARRIEHLFSLIRKMFAHLE